MKRILTFLTMIIMIVMPAKSQDQGSGLYNTGKAFVWYGAGCAITGTAFLMAGNALYNRTSPTQMPTTNLVPIIAGAEGLVGALAALAGTPMMMAGKARMGGNTEGLSLQMGDGKKGLGGQIELGAGVPPYFQITSDVGYHLNDHLYLGGGLAHVFVPSSAGMTPVFFTARTTLSKAKVSPYMSLNMGYELQKGGTYCALNSGVRIKTDNAQNGWTFSSSCEYAEGSGIFTGLKAGFMF